MVTWNGPTFGQLGPTRGPASVQSLLQGGLDGVGCANHVLDNARSRGRVGPGRARADRPRFSLLAELSDLGLVRGGRYGWRRRRVSLCSTRLNVTSWRPWSGRTAHVRDVQRAEIVLGSADGMSNATIARSLSICQNTIRTWRGHQRDPPVAPGLGALR